MVAFKTYEFDSIFNSYHINSKVFLLYGQDEGVINYRKKTLVSYFSKKLQNISITNITADDIYKNPDTLLLLRNSSSLFDDNTLITVNIGSKNIVNHIKESLLQKSPTILLLLAGELKPNNPLRILCESHPNVVTIPCFPQTQRDVTISINDFLGRHKYTFSHDIKQNLIDILPRSPEIRAIELEKLELYMANETNISQTEINEIFVYNSVSNFDTLLYPLFLGDLKNTIAALQNLRNDNIHSSAILLACMKHCLQLLSINGELQNGQSIDFYFKSAIPPIYSSKQNLYRAHLNNVPRGTLNKLHALSLLALKNIRAHGGNHNLHLHNYITNLINVTNEN